MGDFSHHIERASARASAHAEKGYVSVEARQSALLLVCLDIALANAYRSRLVTVSRRTLLPAEANDRRSSSVFQSFI